MNYPQPLKKGVVTDARTRMTTHTVLKMLLDALEYDQNKTIGNEGREGLFEYL